MSQHGFQGQILKVLTSKSSIILLQLIDNHYFTA
ncbi:MAG: hypothetical protein ACI8X3_003315, partial [Saprospiraceae bacterium]